MASSTGHPGAVSREIYWRRRVFVLVGVLLVLAVIAVACLPSAGDETDPTTAQADAGGAADVSPSPSLSPEDLAGDESGEPEEEASEGEEDSEGSSGDGDSEGASDGEGSQEGSGGPAVPQRASDPCRPQDVVVTFEFEEEDRQVYGSGQEPGFRITVVNTEEQTCTVDVGPEAMEIRIHSGDDRIFSTADCVGKGAASDEQRISRGVPYEHTFTWGRERSFTDCRDATGTRPGWYRANLHGDYAGGTGELVFQLKV
ncbi:hypothetical protein [Nocardiopsis sp. LOL_012]|uniref:hypothetical protein n=1 Tax=Nocardiopsis sp. LOL_012 TaxID=3345409 RepID=UPI003A8856AE